MNGCQFIVHIVADYFAEICILELAKFLLWYIGISGG